MTPIWLARAQSFVGLREYPGAPTQPVIAGWLKKLRAWWADDETPWCGTFVAAVMDSCNIPIPSAWYRARAWATWGRELSQPSAGCVVVFNRTGGGHVAIVVGRDDTGRLLCLGGNQGNAVSVAPFERARVLAYRWPPGEPLPAIAALPLIASNAESSSNEV